MASIPMTALSKFPPILASSLCFFRQSRDIEVIEVEAGDCGNDELEGNDCVGNDVKASNSKCASGSVVRDGIKVAELVGAD